MHEAELRPVAQSPAEKEVIQLRERIIRRWCRIKRSPRKSRLEGRLVLRFMRDRARLNDLIREMAA